MGNFPMKVPFYNLGAFVREHKSEVMTAIERVVDSGTYIGGDEVAHFEREFAKSVGSRHCVAVGNGLDAIRLLLEAHGIGAGDEVIVPGFTFYATWLAVLQVGAVPVAVDVKLSDATIDPDKIQDEITSRTRAILVVHLFGVSANMLAINKIAKANALLVLEDCAQAHFGQTNDGPVGNSCDGSAFSFYPTKNLGALGDAGAITLNDSGIADTLRSKRSYGVGLTKYDHITTGWNSRLDPLQAAILNTLLPKLAALTEFRRNAANRYVRALKTFGLPVVQSGTPGENVFHHFVIRSNTRDQIRAALKHLGVETDIHYPYFFNTLDPIRENYKINGLPLPSLPNSKKLSDEVVSLPIGPWMTKEQVDFVVEVLSGQLL